MNTVKVALPPRLPAAYPIHMGAGLLGKPALWLSECVPGASRVVLVADTRVQALYGDALAKRLLAEGYTVLPLGFPPGERSKTQRTKGRLEAAMLAAGCDRQTVCLALGGGVVGDLVGFVAATYMRGIRYMQLPTTLLAMVDSSVGGKTAIDTPYGKNLIGAFWQPAAVVADVACLETLPRRHRVNGLIEAIKLCATDAAEVFAWVEQMWERLLACEPEPLALCIAQVVALKAAVVVADETETGVRMRLNFGHTIGHALEHLTQYRLLHGYAVGYGMLVEARIAVLQGHLTLSEWERLAALLERLGVVPSALKRFSVDALIAATRTDKKAAQGQVRYVLLAGIGTVVEGEGGGCVHPISDACVAQALREVVG